MQRLGFILLFSLILQLVYAQIQPTIQKIISEDASQNASFGISVRSDKGLILYEFNAKTRLIPASTFKLITTLSAIDLLGEGYQYETFVGYSGELLKDGTLKGDLVIIGSGDPSLGSNEFSKSIGDREALQLIADGIKAKGITCIDGRVLVNDWIFDRKAIHPSWAWDDLTNYYASGAWGFNFHDNYYHLRFGRSVASDKETSILGVDPNVPLMTMENRVTTGPQNSGDNAYIYGDPYRNVRHVEGTIPPGKTVFSIKGAIPDPPLFGAYQVFEHLEENGILATSYGLANNTKESLSEVTNLVSLSVSELAIYANEVSDNMYCEAFLKTIGAAKGRQGSFQSGKNAIEEHLNELGAPIGQIHIEDGSGLSARNRVSPNFMTFFLNAKRSSLGTSKLKTFIPKVGERGSVRNFLKGYKSQEFAWLKSGSINNVLAYSGLLELKSGQVVSISVMANGQSSNRTMRKQIEKVIETIYQEL